MPESSSAPLPLEGLRVLDFTWVLAGPYATRLLADFGAEVIKVQPPLSSATDEFSRGYYRTWNRNKLGITLDLSKDGGVRIARGLVGICDVVVENFSPRVMSNLGLDYPELEKIKPDIIYLSLSAMGHSGPWQNYSGYGPTLQAFSGLSSLTSYPDRPPSGAGYSHADHIAGLYASLAILGALEYRRRTGKGQYIDLSETEAMTGLVFEAIKDRSATGPAAADVKPASRRLVPDGIYPCLGQDRWCAVSVSSQAEWKSFKRALGNPEWAEREEFASIKLRNKNAARLDELTAAWTAGHTAEEVMSALQKEGVPAGVVQNAADLAGDPQLRERGFFVRMGDEKLTDANPIRLADSPARYRQPAPSEGQDNEYVYRGLLGLSEQEYLRYRREKVI